MKRMSVARKHMTIGVIALLLIIFPFFMILSIASMVMLGAGIILMVFSVFSHIKDKSKI